jgi:hypothetical protein
MRLIATSNGEAEVRSVYPQKWRRASHQSGGGPVQVLVLGLADAEPRIGGKHITSIE